MLYTVFMRAREIIKISKKNGWEVIRQKGSHVQLKKGNDVVTVPDQGTKDIKAGTVKSIEESTKIELRPRPAKKKSKE
jgi:predicted RNA binding protein YcfA (HicA-like mRNA interferase family)